MLTNELQSTWSHITREERLMYVLGGQDENFDSVFATVTEKMLSEKVEIDDVKDLLLSHESKIESRKVLTSSCLPLFIVSVKTQGVNGMNNGNMQRGFVNSDMNGTGNMTNLKNQFNYNGFSSQNVSNFQPQNSGMWQPLFYPQQGRFGGNSGRNGGNGNIGARKVVDSPTTIIGISASHVGFWPLDFKILVSI